MTFMVKRQNEREQKIFSNTYEMKNILVQAKTLKICQVLIVKHFSVLKIIFSRNYKIYQNLWQPEV